MLKPLTASQKMRVAYANGVRTIGEYAQYIKRIRGDLPREVIPDYMNRAIAEQTEKERR